jgi:predicted small integral membrane protein
MRMVKILGTASMGLLLGLFAFENLTDYNVNFQFVRHVLSMDTIFPDSAIQYRAITAPWAHHLAYALIIATEVVASAATWLGAWRMWKERHAPIVAFVQARRAAVFGLALGCALYFVGFMVVGGEWFGMWMSSQWNGIPSAFRFLVCLGGMLAFLGVREDDSLHR